MNDRKKILDKIRKAMALSKSDNEHEAAAALRQAHKLMELHGITNADIDAAEITDSLVRAGASVTPAEWEVVLAERIANAFSVRLRLVSRWQLNSQLNVKRTGVWKFIGVGADPEIAAYAFTVLVRQCRAARRRHLDEKLSRRLKPKTRTARADSYCLGWVLTAVRSIVTLLPATDKIARIDGFLESKPAQEGAPRRRAVADDRDFCCGAAAGRAAELHRAMRTDQAAAQITSK